MKISLPVRDILESQFGDATHIPCTVDIADVLDHPDLDETYQVDLDDLLEESHAIAHVWCIDDVREERPDLDADQAWEVLRECRTHLDSNLGITWATIRDAANTLYGEANKRVDRFGRIVDSYTSDDPRENLVDVLTDARHWSRSRSCNFDDALRTASERFADEIGGMV